MAKARKPSIDDKCLDDLLQCIICFGPFTNPKVLQCGHTFCQECLQQHHNASQEDPRRPSASISCPTCREETLIPPRGIAGLRHDFKVSQLEEVLRKGKQCNRRSSNTCTPCASQNKTVGAKVYCFSCDANYCKGCLRKHSANPVFKDHTVVDRSTQLDSDKTELPCQVCWLYC